MTEKERSYVAFRARVEAEKAAQTLKRPKRRVRWVERTASREEQYGRYLDCGPLAWDDR